MIAFWRAVFHDCLLAGSVGFVTRYFFSVKSTDPLLNHQCALYLATFLTFFFPFLLVHCWREQRLKAMVVDLGSDDCMMWRNLEVCLAAEAQWSPGKSWDLFTEGPQSEERTRPFGYQ